jgi:hypothetical protein
MAEKTTPKKLPTHLESKFKLKPGFEAGKFIHRGALVDLQKVSVERAKQLIEDGFQAIEVAGKEDKPTDKK